MAVHGVVRRQNSVAAGLSGFSTREDRTRRQLVLVKCVPSKNEITIWR